MTKPPNQQPFAYQRLAPPTRLSLNLREVWNYRDLVYFLLWRDIKVRYKYTVLGIGWAVAQPLLTMLVFTFFFSRLAKVPSDGLPYGVFALAGLVPWILFANGASQSASSLAGASAIIKRVYFPKLVVPMAAVGTSFVDFCWSFLVLLGFSAASGISLKPQLVLAPLVAAGIVAVALGVGLWFAACSIKFRDVRYLVPVLLQLWLFASPVAYPKSIIPSQRGQLLFSLNPMTGWLEAFRWCLLGAPKVDWSSVAIAFVVTTLVLLSGACFFRSVEHSVADQL